MFKLMYPSLCASSYKIYNGPITLACFTICTCHYTGIRKLKGNILTIFMSKIQRARAINGIIGLVWDQNYAIENCQVFALLK